MSSRSTACLKLALLVFAGLAPLLLLPSISAARDVGALGGGGGNAFRSPCNTSDVMIGLSMMTGKALDRVSPICIRITPQRTWTGEAYEGNWQGGNGGSYQKIACQPGYAVRHLHVFMDKFKIVNHINITCQDLNSGQWHDAVPQVAGEAIGDVRFSCADGEYASGIFGRAGTLVDQAGLMCETVAAIPVAAPAPAPQPAPVPGPAPEPAPPAQQVATVNADVDLYDAPGGNGNVIGVLRQGTQVTLAEPGCTPNAWCHVNEGYVWGEFLTL